jgi:hypothetical protein
MCHPFFFSVKVTFKTSTISPHQDSLSSDATVVEKTSQTFDIEEAFVDMRSRKGSYTLDHPSPSLIAYMKKTGKSGMNTIPKDQKTDGANHVA